jgi:rubrerythrin
MDYEKLKESAEYLTCCSNIEIEAFRLYENLSRKINNPESSFILGIAYDSLKYSKIIQALLQTFDDFEVEGKNCKKNLTSLLQEVTAFSKTISKINNIDEESMCEILKELIKLEDLLSEAYTYFIQSFAPKILAEELSKLAPADLSNLKKVFETFIEEKENHRAILIEIIYYFEAKEADRLKHLNPIVKYQNPDSWIRQSTLHAFSSTPVKYESA